MKKYLLVTSIVVLGLFLALFFFSYENSKTELETAELHGNISDAAKEAQRESMRPPEFISTAQKTAVTAAPPSKTAASLPIDNSDARFAHPEKNAKKNKGGQQEGQGMKSELADSVLLDFSASADKGLQPLDKHDTATVDEQTADDEETSRRLSGWVFDEAGKAVPGISVEATARYSTTGGNQSASTDGKGFFEFSQLQDGTYQVRTKATEQYESASAMLQAGTLTAVLVVREQTDSSLTVHGVVESTSGEVLQDVRVEPAGQGRNSAYTDEQGRYSLQLALDRQNEQVTLRFLLDGYQEGHLSLNGQQLAGVKATEANIRLEPAEQVPVVGMVQGDDGQPVQWARVQLYSSSFSQTLQALTDAGGRFSLAQVRPGDDYRLWVHPQEGYRDYIEEHVHIGSSGANLNIVLDQLGYGNLSGQMLDPEGRAVPNFSLWLRTDQASSGPAVSITGDSSGRFTVNNLPEGGVTLQTRSAPEFAFSGIKVVSNVSTEVRLGIDTGNYKLEGFVLDSKGQRLALAKVRLTWSLEQEGIRSRSSRETLTDAAGYFLFMQLGTGTHELSISKDGYRPLRQNAMVNAKSKVLVLSLEKISLQ